MEAKQTYKSFNSNKPIEEIQYYILKDLTALENLKFELNFYELLLNKPIYKPRKMNLYETLVKFKNEIHAIIESNVALINELSSHANHIQNKMECDDTACDDFFLKKHDTMELKIFNFNIKIFNFKFRLFQYLESVIIN